MNRKKIAALGAACALGLGLAVGGFALTACDGPEAMLDAGIDAAVRMRDAMSDDAAAQDSGPPAPVGPRRVEADCEVLAEVLGHDPTDGSPESRQLWGAQVTVESGQRVTAEVCDLLREDDGTRQERALLRCESLDSCEPVTGPRAECESAPIVEREADRATVHCGTTGWAGDSSRWHRVVFWID